MPPSPPPTERQPYTASRVRTTSTDAQLSSQQGPTLPGFRSITSVTAAESQQVSPAETGTAPTARAFGVHSILNPTSEPDTKKPARVTQSPSRNLSANFSSYQTPLLSPRIRKRRDESPGRGSPTATDVRQGRRMLTPKSPALRSMSQTLRGSPSATGPFNASTAPAESRVYTAEPGESPSGRIPPLPPMSTLQSHMHSTPQDLVHGSAPGSYSNSSASYSANTQAYIGSPSSSSNIAEREAPSPFRHPGSDTGPIVSNQGNLAHGSQIRAGGRSYGVGQPPYQMELSTDTGPMIVPVEVDVQQASRSADEKRKRNAGASARFRQRRKEKEQAASQHISDLQKQVRDVTEERDFYIRERNIFRDILARTPGCTIPPRPPSPQTRRGQGAPSFASGRSEPAASIEYGRSDLGEPSPAQRRRTSDYQPSFVAPPLQHSAYASPYPPVQPQGFGLPPPAPPQMSDPRGHAVGPAPVVTPQTLPQASPSTSQQPSGRPGPYDPFRREPNPR